VRGGGRGSKPVAAWQQSWVREKGRKLVMGRQALKLVAPDRLAGLALPKG